LKKSQKVCFNQKYPQHLTFAFQAKKKTVWNLNPDREMKEFQIRPKYFFCWGVQKSFSSLNDPLCEFLKFPRRVQKIISPQNGTNRDLFKYISS
jgi:hypothetical protein